MRDLSTKDLVYMALIVAVSIYYYFNRSISLALFE